MGTVAGWLTWVIGYVLVGVLFFKLLSLPSKLLSGGLTFLLTPVFVAVLGESNVLHSVVGLEYSQGDFWIFIFLGQFSASAGIVLCLASAVAQYTGSKPSASTTSNDIRVGKKMSVWWQTLFYINAIGLVSSLLMGGWSAVHVFSSAWCAVGILGLWGFINNQMVFKKTFWVGYFYGSAVLYIAFLGLIFPESIDFVTQGMISLMSFVGICIALFFFIPHFVAMWRYAYRSQHIWDATTTQKSLAAN